VKLVHLVRFIPKKEPEVAAT